MYSNLNPYNSRTHSSMFITITVILSIAIPWNLIPRISYAQDAIHIEEINILKGEVLKNREMLQQLMMLQARNAMSADERKKQDDKLQEQIVNAKKQITDPTDSFGTDFSKYKEGPLKDFRKNLQKQVDTASSVQITAATSPEEVQKVIEAIENGKKLVLAARKDVIQQYQSLVSSLPDQFSEVLTKPVLKVNWLEKLGADKLRPILKSLDPSISPETLMSMTAEEIATKVYANFTNEGRLTPEVMSALGEKLVQEAIKENTGIDLGVSDVKRVVDAAKSVVDVHRSSADFAEFSVSLLTAAISTGNPYVIAAAAAIVALIALFKFVFGKGGGGGGDGPGSGKGTGSEGRNTGAGNPERQPGNDQVSQEGDVVLGSDGTFKPTGGDNTEVEANVGTTKDGDYTGFLIGDKLTVKTKDGKEHLVSDLSSVEDHSGNNAGIKGGSGIKLLEVSSNADGFKLETNGIEKNIKRVGKNWKLIEPTSKDSENGWQISGNTLSIFKGLDETHNISIVKIEKRDVSGKFSPAGLTSKSVKTVTRIEIDPTNKMNTKIYCTLDTGAKVYFVKKGDNWHVFDDDSGSNPTIQ
ncbi:hypothetical protein Pan153_24260 [Gimesia panareensis]|uniref:Uncharacterized protein n=1 Tax=Gimesia panareensis TaxID=2527978 RepID=A0A518FN50_9PLAN|nr:hypothetical protein [Gimesia panareensis]QDV17771.1 hypothetical protein Pan153_24260 [Gimesia panareensis]